MQLCECSLRKQYCCLEYAKISPRSSKVEKMVELEFTLSPEGCARVHDALLCMNKFSDTVAVEARADRVGSSSGGSLIHSLEFDHFLAHILRSQPGKVGIRFVRSPWLSLLRVVLLQARLKEQRRPVHLRDNKQGQ